jgi:Zn-dependent protease
MSKQNCIKLFRFSGVTVYLHLSWIVVAIFEIQNRRGNYSSLTYNIAEYLVLFLTVLLHEFGHALACKQVGGSAETIMLWPLGGIAYVSPPQRPGAVLWSIGAGPLVNVVLAVLSFAALISMSVAGLEQRAPDLFNLVNSIVWINVGLFLFNILPIYPLDGGQILRAILWFIVGPVKSLTICSVIGIVGALCAAVYSLIHANTWLVIMSLFLLMHACSAFKIARQS